MSVEITVTGFKQAIDGLQLLTNRAYPLAVKTLQEAGREMADEARANAPVKTGRLRASIGSEDTPTGAIISAKAPYAGFVEWGTSRMTGRGYMSAAAGQVFDKLQALFEAEIR